jgi:hypothetical protein
VVLDLVALFSFFSATHYNMPYVPRSVLTVEICSKPPKSNNRS